MLQSKLPIKYWGESLFTATYLINRMATVVLDCLQLCLIIRLLLRFFLGPSHIMIILRPLDAYVMLPHKRDIGTS